MGTEAEALCHYCGLPGCDAGEDWTDLTTMLCSHYGVGRERWQEMVNEEMAKFGYPPSPPEPERRERRNYHAACRREHSERYGRWLKVGEG